MVLASTNGVIDDMWYGGAGNVSLVVPKNTSKIWITDLNTNSLLIGKFITNTSADVAISGGFITGVSAKNSKLIFAAGCSISADEIALTLRELVLVGNENGILNLLGGGNAHYDTWSQQAKDDLVTLVTDLNWDVRYVGE
jgi:hypothetical protein